MLLAFLLLPFLYTLPNLKGIYASFFTLGKVWKVIFASGAARVSEGR